MPEISQEELDKLKSAATQAEELSTKVSTLEANKQRILEESVNFKKRAQDAESKISEAEKAKLEEQGKFEELLATERSERKGLETKLKDREDSVLREKLRTEVLKHAPDAHDVDMLLKVNEHQDLLKIDRETLSIEGVKEFTDKVRESRSFLFNPKRMSNTTNLPPGGQPPVDDFSSDEDKYLEELKGCNTRAEMVAVKKKYNKPVDSYHTL